eukprot:scaffold287_cov337-Pavlova_lutheri.AAC.51
MASEKKLPRGEAVVRGWCLWGDRGEWGVGNQRSDGVGQGDGRHRRTLRFTREALREGLEGAARRTTHGKTREKRIVATHPRRREAAAEKGTNPPNKDTENKEKCVLCTTSPTVGSPSKAENEWKRPNKTNCRPCYSCRHKGKPRNSSWPTREVGPLGGVQRTQQGPALPWVRHVKLETRKRSKTWIWT